MSDDTEKYTSQEQQLLDTAQKLADSGQSSAALPLYEQVVALIGQRMGVTNRRYAAVLNDLASVWIELADANAALAPLEEALAIYKGLASAPVIEIMAITCNLARAYCLQGRSEDASAIEEWGCARIEQLHGADNQLVVELFQNLANHYHKLGRLPEARTRYQRALTVAERRSGASHPATAVPRFNLALNAYHSGDLGMASPLVEAAIKTLRADRRHDPQLLAKMERVRSILSAAALLETADQLGAKLCFLPEGSASLISNSSILMIEQPDGGIHGRPVVREEVGLLLAPALRQALFNGQMQGWDKIVRGLPRSEQQIVPVVLLALQRELTPTYDLIILRMAANLVEARYVWARVSTAPQTGANAKQRLFEQERELMESESRRQSILAPYAARFTELRTSLGRPDGGIGGALRRVLGRTG